jgi:hypothetical protein
MWKIPVVKHVYRRREIAEGLTRDLILKMSSNLGALVRSS